MYLVTSKQSALFFESLWDSQNIWTLYFFILVTGRMIVAIMCSVPVQYMAETIQLASLWTLMNLVHTLEICTSASFVWRHLSISNSLHKFVLTLQDRSFILHEFWIHLFLFICKFSIKKYQVMIFVRCNSISQKNLLCQKYTQILSK